MPLDPAEFEQELNKLPSDDEFSEQFIRIDIFNSHIIGCSTSGIPWNL